MTFGETALSFALDEMAAGHGEEGGNNAGQWVKMYLNGLAEPPANWCAAFVCWCCMKAAEMTDMEMPFNYSLSALNVENQFQAKGWLLGHDDEVAPGDIVFFWRGDPNGWMGHIGFVNLIDPMVDMIYTIEGNRGTALAKVKALPYKFGQTDKHYMALTGISLDNITMGFMSYGRIP